MVVSVLNIDPYLPGTELDTGYINFVNQCLYYALVVVGWRVEFVKNRCLMLMDTLEFLSFHVDLGSLLNVSHAKDLQVPPCSSERSRTETFSKSQADYVLGWIFI